MQQLRPKQLTAIRLLLKDFNYAQVCREIKINRETLRRWKKDPTFEAEYKRQLEARQNLSSGSISSIA